MSLIIALKLEMVFTRWEHFIRGLSVSLVLDKLAEKLVLQKMSEVQIMIFFSIEYIDKCL